MEGAAGRRTINENLPFVRFINKEFSRCCHLSRANERKLCAFTAFDNSILCNVNAHF